MKIKLKVSAAREDCEKLITPGIVWINKVDKGIRAICIFVGWWHFSIGLLIGYKILNSQPSSESVTLCDHEQKIKDCVHKEVVKFCNDVWQCKECKKLLA